MQQQGPKDQGDCACDNNVARLGEIALANNVARHREIADDNVTRPIALATSRLQEMVLATPVLGGSEISRLRMTL